MPESSDPNPSSPSLESPESPQAVNPAPDTQLPTGPGFALTFLYYFSGSALVAMVLAVKSSPYGLSTGVPGQLALIVGAVGGFLGGFFNHTMMLEVPFTNRKAFVKSLEAVLTPLGYELAEEVDKVQVYRRSSLRQLFSGSIYVEIQQQRAVLSSRAMTIRVLRKRLLA